MQYRFRRGGPEGAPGVRLPLNLPCQFDQITQHQIGFNTPRIKHSVSVAPDPRSLRTGGFGADHIPGVARDQPGFTQGSIDAAREINVDGRTWLEGSDIVGTDDAFK